MDRKSKNSCQEAGKKRNLMYVNININKYKNIKDGKNTNSCQEAGKKRNMIGA